MQVTYAGIYYMVICASFLRRAANFENMSIQKGKRQRSPNWTPAEKLLLLDLIEDKFLIIENKKTDGVTNRQKMDEWARLTKLYNSRTAHGFRTGDNLKAQWECMKKNAKKEESRRRIDLIKTGGGPSSMPKKEDPIHLRIIELIKTTAIGLFNPFDGDSDVPVNVDHNESSPNYIEEMRENAGECFIAEMREDEEECFIADMRENGEEFISAQATAETGLNREEFMPAQQAAKAAETAKRNSQSSDWGDYTPQKLKKPVSKELQTNNWSSRRRPAHTATSTSLQRLHAKKIEAIDVQVDISTKESDAGQSRDSQMHELQMEILRENLKQEEIRTRLLLLEERLAIKRLENDSM